jgi:hypothetical protein
MYWQSPPFFRTLLQRSKTPSPRVSTRIRTRKQFSVVKCGVTTDAVRSGLRVQWILRGHHHASHLGHASDRFVIHYCLYWPTCPPSTGIIAPCKNEASSEARNRLTAAISFGSPIRPKGNLTMFRRPGSFKASQIIGVSTAPGQTQLTLTPLAAQSTARHVSRLPRRFLRRYRRQHPSSPRCH